MLQDNIIAETAIFRYTGLTLTLSRTSPGFYASAAHVF